jgi:hypothetical protein
MPPKHVEAPARSSTDPIAKHGAVILRGVRGVMVCDGIHR